MSCKRGKRALDLVLPDVQVSETHTRYFELTNWGRMCLELWSMASVMGSFCSR